MNGDAVLFHALDDAQGSERRRLNEGTIDLVRLGVESLAQDQSGETRVDEDGAVAIVPIEGEEACLARLHDRKASLHLDEFFIHGRAVGIGHEVIHEPEEDVPHGRLTCFDSVVPGQDRAIDNATDAWHVAERSIVGQHGDVTGARPENLYQRARLYPGSDRAHVGVEGSDRDGDAGGESEFVGPLGREIPRFGIRGIRGRVKPLAQLGESRIELSKELRIGQSAPGLGEHGLVPSGADAALDAVGALVPRQDGGKPVAMLHPRGGGGENTRIDLAASPDLAPPPLARVNAAALGEVLGALFGREGGDRGGFLVGGVVFPEPDVGIKIVGELRRERERSAVGIDRDRRAPGRIDTDADDLGWVKVGPFFLRLGEGSRDDCDHAIEIVLRMLPRHVRV